MCDAIQTVPLFCLISDHTLPKVIGASTGVVVLLVVVGVVIWWVLKKRKSRKENTTGDYSIPKNFSRSEFYKSKKVSFCQGQVLMKVK